MPEIYDHLGKPVKHARARINGLRMHYVTAGEGEPLLLIHGTPKTHYYWYKLIPLLTEHFTVIAPDLRGFGDTDKPKVEQGYDSRTNAKDLADLMASLGYDKYLVHGEDRGAEYAYVLAATNREHVKAVVIGEQILSGYGLEEASYFSEENLSARIEGRGTWQWHIPFFWIADVPEFLIQGKEREFWEWWMRAEMWNPNALGEEAVAEWIQRLKEPGGLRGTLETYRAGLTNARINRELAKDKLDIPVLTIGAPEFSNTGVEACMKQLCSNIEKSVIFEECGHSLALEAPERLAKELIDFFAGK